MAQRMIGERQRWAWLTAGLSAVAAAKTCSLGWLWVLVGGLVVTLYYIYMDRFLRPCGVARLLTVGMGRVGRVLAVLTFLWTTVLLAWSAGLADAAFPMVDGFPVLGLVLLGVAAWGGNKGEAACARCAGVLCLFLIVLYGIVAVFSVPDIQPRFLAVRQPWENSLWAAGLFLLPAAVMYVPCRQSRKKPVWLHLLLLPGAAVLLAVICDGVLSPQLAAIQTAPLYTVAQSVSIFGVLERIEPLVSAAMTMGVFSLLSAMACACRALGNEMGKQSHYASAACAGAAVLLWPAARLSLPVITIGTVIFYFLIPLLAVITGRNYKNTNRKWEK